MIAIRHVRAFTRQIPVYPKEAIDERIEAILDNFAFDSVRAAMTALKWTWKGEADPPTEADMRANAKKVLRWASRLEPGQAVTSGGFRARTGENAELVLEFLLTHQEETFSKEDDDDKPAAPGFACVSVRGPRKEKSDVR